MTRALTRPALSAAFASLLAGCATSTGYAVGVRLADPDAGPTIASVEVYVVSSCDAVTPGQPPPASAVIAAQSFGTHRTAMRLGDVPPGTIGIYGLARHELCWVMATGCQTHEVHAGGSGLLDVTIAAPRAMINCPGTELCFSGECREQACPDGQTACAGQCVVLASSPLHCGSCGHSCGDAGCTLGACQQ